LLVLACLVNRFDVVTAESFAVSVQNMDKIRYFYIVASI